MLPWDAAFVMCLLAVAYRRIRDMERLSTSIVAFAVTMIALWVQPTMEAALRGRDLGFGAKMGLVWFTLICGWCFLRWREDGRSPPGRGPSA